MRMHLHNGGMKPLKIRFKLQSSKMETSLIKLLQTRKASRAIDAKSLDGDAIESLMASAQLSASCFNNQPWRFLFLYEEAALALGREALSSGNRWAKAAPLLIICFTKSDLDCRIKDGRTYSLFDLGMATQLILLQATELDLVARPMAGFNVQQIKNAFQIPEVYEVLVLIAVGYDGDIDALDERLKKVSKAPRKRNPLAMNFFHNSLPDNFGIDHE